jgi:hypothetical protein
MVKQLSVFLENKPGTLNKALLMLKNNDVNIVAISLADTSEFGLARLIVDDLEKGRSAIREGGYTSTLADVIAVRLAQRVGYLQEILDKLSAAGINVEYMYTASTGPDGADLIMKTSDPAKAEEVLAEAKAEVLKQDDLRKLGGDN